ncbi:hypothetical protein BH24ACT22_BH24ACT22_12060 [soil metagenome]
MGSAPEQFYRKDFPDPVANMRDPMSRSSDFDLDPERDALELDRPVFEVAAALDALRVESESLI